MRFQTDLIPGRLVRRYKRFLADVILEADGREVTVHCPNPGAMLGLADAGMRVWLEPNDDPRKKLKYGWRLVELDNGHFAGIDTGVPNRVVKEALLAHQIPELGAYIDVRPEVPYAEKSRVDFLLTASDGRQTYVEVKNVHLRRTGTLAEFPDCVTLRGARHLGDLAGVVEQGHRAVMLYLVQRTDCTALDFARDLDPGYGKAFDAAVARGVEAIAYDTVIETSGVAFGKPVPIEA